MIEYIMTLVVINTIMLAIIIGIDRRDNGPDK